LGRNWLKATLGEQEKQAQANKQAQTDKQTNKQTKPIKTVVP
jgi:hypothetical protein